MKKWLLEITDRIFVVGGALLFSQLPLYMQQYEQRLAGHIDELRYQLDAIRKLALQSGKTLDQYIDKFISNADADFSSHGTFIHAMQLRFVKLSDALSQLNEASVFRKPFAFFRHFDLSMGKASLYDFKPGLLLTVEGICYAVLGMAAGYALFKLLKFLVSLRFANQRNQN